MSSTWPITQLIPKTSGRWWFWQFTRGEFTVLHAVDNTSAESPFDGNSDAIPSSYSSFAEYFSKKYGITLMHPGQPLLLLKQSHNAHNLLVDFRNEVTEVVWKGGETETKADSNTMKKADKNSVSNTVNRAAAPAAKKSPTVGGTALSNPGGKAGNKKAANVKDPKQGNIMSFVKKV